jgi:hypothetical protein
MLKEMEAVDWAAGKSRTGIETSPKEMVPEASERGAIQRL